MLRNGRLWLHVQREIRNMGLHQITVTFADVSGVTTARTRNGTFTDFNFVANGRREYAVQISGAVGEAIEKSAAKLQ